MVMSVTPVSAGDFKLGFNADLGYLFEDFDLTKTSRSITFNTSINRDFNLKSSLSLTYKDMIKASAHYDAIENTNQDRYLRLDIMPTGLTDMGGKLNAGVWARYGEFRNRVGGYYEAVYGMIGVNINGILEF
jgi:hypothetical protein